jgi:VWFA-related protein
MKNTVAVALIAALLFSPAAFTQEAPVFGETLEIRVTNVEVIVSDKGGKPVHGLTKDDFEVYENGVRQEVTNFAEIGESIPSGTLATVPGETPAEQPVTRDFRRRLISVFIDNASLDTGNRASVLPQLRQFLASNVRPGDGIAIYSWGNSLNVQLEPTSDPAAIAAAVDKLASRTALIGNWRQDFRGDLDFIIATYKDREPPEKAPIGDAISTAGAYAVRGSSEMRQKAAALKSVIASLRGIEGRKILVMLTESLSSNPGEDAFQYVDSIKYEFTGGETFNPFSHAKPYALEGLAREIANAANSAGVTLYPIHAAGKWADSAMLDASQTMTARGGPPMQTDTSTQTLHMVAEDTGGKAMTGSSNFKLAFDTISNDLNVYYSLGYRTDGARQDRMKNVEVKLRKKGYAVRTRKAIVEQTAATEMNDMVAANLFQARATNDLNIKAGIGTATAAGENLVHPLTITIPTSTLTLLPDGTDLVGKFSVFAAFLRSDGAVSSVGRQTQQFRFPAASLAKRKEVTVKLDVTADARVGAISLGVMDEASSATGFALVKLPPPAEKSGSTE